MTDRDIKSPLSPFYEAGMGSRRDLLQVTLGVAATAGAGSAAAKTKPKKASAAPKDAGTPVAPIALPFAEDALAPVISANTFSFHYGKHYKTYCDTTAKLVVGTPLEGATLEKIIEASVVNTEQKKLFNNAAQAWNHVFYWRSLSPKQQAPTGKLLDAINRDFGSLDAMNTQFAEAAVNQFGSGWAWLVVEGGKLKIVSTSNADLPIIHDQDPLLTLDVWEHAYYLDYQNKRPDYAKAVIAKTLNWEFAAKNFASA
ncbi:MAG: superoxide dismutase [Caulobacterales bacterium]